MEKITLSIAEFSDKSKKEVDYVIVSYDHMAISEYKRRLSEMPECVVNGNVYKTPLVTYTIEEKEFDVDSFKVEMTDFVMKYYDRADEVLGVGVGYYYGSFGWSKSGEAIVYIEVKRPGDGKRFGDTGGNVMCLLCNKNTKTFRAYGLEYTTRSKRNELMIE